MQNTNKPYPNPDMQQYFNTLPAYIQESMMQSGVKFTDLNQMRSFVAGLNSKS